MSTSHTPVDADDELTDLMEQVEIETPGDTVSTLAEIATDLVVAHKELDSYKNGAMLLSQYLDEAVIEQEILGNDDAVRVLRDLKRLAFGVYLRLQRGDLELAGDREGKFSGYFASEEESDEGAGEDVA